VNTCSKLHITILKKFDDKMSHAVFGLGNARWGNFSVMGLSWGPYYSFTHIYSAIFSNLIGKLDIVNLGSSMNGYWKTAWQGATGTFLSSENGASIDHAEKMPAKNSNGERLLGTWKVAVTCEQFSELTQMNIFESKYCGFCAEISWRGTSNQKVLGNIYGNIVSFSCLWPDFSNVLTVLCQVIENGFKMEGRVLAGAGGFSHQFGVLSAQKMVQQSE